MLKSAIIDYKQQLKAITTNDDLTIEEKRVQVEDLIFKQLHIMDDELLDYTREELRSLNSEGESRCQ